MLIEIIAVVSMLFMACFNYLQARNSIFRNLQLPFPEPGLLFGNLLDIIGKPMPLQLPVWTRQFGRVYGIMEGGTPVLVTTDLNVLQDVFVKKFSNFHARKTFPLQRDPDKAEEINVFASRGLRWKRLRTIASQAFTSSKLKRLVPTMEESVETMVQIMEKQAEAETSFNIHKNFQDLTLEVIARVAFGETRQLQDNPDNPYLEHCRQVFAQRPSYSPIALFSMVATILPELKPIILALFRFLLYFQPMSFRKLMDKVRLIVKERKELKNSYRGATDFIQLFLDAEAEEGWQNQDASLTWDEAKAAGLRVDKKLTQSEIVAQCNLFILAGFETTSNALAYTAYLLALNPDYQQRLLEEIESVWPDEADLDTEALFKLELLDQVIKESLRMYPIAAIVNARVCQTPCYAGDIWVPEGMTVQADVMSIHYDRKIWGDDADSFRPERFADSSRHPLAWQPFGAGPRLCIGMRFAQMEVKITLAHLIKRFRIHKCDETEVPLTLQGAATMSPKSVDVRLSRR